VPNELNDERREKGEGSYTTKGNQGIGFFFGREF
jgi:hypothetical protein